MGQNPIITGYSVSYFTSSEHVNKPLITLEYKSVSGGKCCLALCGTDPIALCTDAPVMVIDRVHMILLLQLPGITQGPQVPSTLQMFMGLQVKDEYTLLSSVQSSWIFFYFYLVSHANIFFKLSPASICVLYFKWSKYIKCFSFHIPLPQSNFF